MFCNSASADRSRLDPFALSLRSVPSATPGWKTIYTSLLFFEESLRWISRPEGASLMYLIVMHFRRLSMSLDLFFVWTALGAVNIIFLDQGLLGLRTSNFPCALFWCAPLLKSSSNVHNRWRPPSRSPGNQLRPTLEALSDMSLLITTLANLYQNSCIVEFYNFSWKLFVIMLYLCSKNILRMSQCLTETKCHRA